MILLGESMFRVFDGARSWSSDRLTPALMHGVLRALSVACRLDPVLRRELSGVHPTGVPFEWDATIVFTTEDGRHRACAHFREGKMSVAMRPRAAVDTTVTFAGLPQVRTFFLPGGDPLNMLLDSGMVVDGNLTHLAKFAHLATLFQNRGRQLPPGDSSARFRSPGRWQDLRVRRAGEASDVDPGTSEARAVAHDPVLARYSLDDFPRVKRLLHAHRAVQPEICPERARLLTEFVLREQSRPGVEGETSALRQARALNAILTGKAAIINDDDLLAGTTTSRRIGVVLYPETHGTTIWPELLTVGARQMNPYRISDEDIQTLSTEVFPFWLESNIREHTKRREDYPESLRLDERFFLYFQWKSYAVSHTIADMPRMLDQGLLAMAREAKEREATAADDEKRQFFQALQIALQGVVDYAEHLSERAGELANGLRGTGGAIEARRAELLELQRICKKVPAGPAETLAEAIQAVWIVFLCLHQENINAGLSVGRLDLWLQPYLERDLEGCDDDTAREEQVERAIELVSAFMLKLTDHLPLVPDIGNRLFGGSSSDQVITLGGVKPDGSSAVCDMTWIFLKATEMLALRDPNMNARFAPGVNSEAYLRRLCEVNLITGATPSLHNDAAMIPALTKLGFALEEARDWGATGCVEPTICGQHFGHTGCLMFNMVAPFEMAVHNGVHPVMGTSRIGPATGDPAAFRGFDDFMAAYEQQLAWQLDMAIDANNRLGRSHQELKPTPLLSALFQGPLESGQDVIDGGARHNSTGMALVGLPDVIDSLAAVKTVVFDEERVDWETLAEALDANFEGHELLLAELQNKIPKFGSDDRLTRDLSREIMDFVYARLGEYDHYRGGRYLPGYWSMSNHVAFGLLSGALPSGRLQGKAFAPGLTPTPGCTAPLTEQISAVAALDTSLMPNNLAFNVKVVPGADDSHRAVVDRMTAYSQAYFDLGGMQMQFNVMDDATLRDAMENPDDHRDLLVRISGYNAYFVDLNRPMQEELIERTSHLLGR